MGGFRSTCTCIRVAGLGSRWHKPVVNGCSSCRRGRCKVSHEVYFIDVSFIDHNPFQPRAATDPDQLRELAQDILSKCEMLPDTVGLMQLPVVRHSPVHEERYELLFGHRRLEAFKLLAPSTPIYAWMPCLIQDVSNEEMIATAWAENAVRLDLSLIEEAEYIVRLMDDFGWTMKRTCDLLGIPIGTGSNLVRLLRLPDEIKQAMHAGKISKAIGLELLRLPSFDTPEARSILATAATSTYTEVHRRVNQFAKGGDRRFNDTAFEDVVAPAAQALADALADGHDGAWLLVLRKLGVRDPDVNGDVRVAVAERVLRMGLSRSRDTRSVKREIVNTLEDADVESPWNKTAMVKVDQFLHWRMGRNGQAKPVTNNSLGSGQC